VPSGSDAGGAEDRREVALRDLLAHVRAHHAVDAELRLAAPGREGLVVGERIGDAPDHVVVHDEALAVHGLDRERLGVQVEPAAVEAAHRVDAGDAEREARRGRGLGDRAPEPQHDLLLVLVGDDERPDVELRGRHQARERRREQHEQDREPLHCGALRSRPSGRCGSTLVVPGSMITFSTAGRTASIVSR
jgi:hypothetical protein